MNNEPKGFKVKILNLKICLRILQKNDKKLLTLPL